MLPLILSGGPLRNSPGSDFPLAGPRDTMYRAFLVVVAILGIAGCRDATPVVSARTVDGRVLSGQQIAALNTWLENHRAGWGANFATPPVPSTVIIVRQSSGKVSSIELFDKAGWTGAAIFDGRVGSFPPQEVAALRRQLGLDR